MIILYSKTMLSYRELKPGTIFVMNGEPYEVLEYNFLRLQQRKPVVQTKIKNLISAVILISGLFVGSLFSGNIKSFDQGSH